MYFVRRVGSVPLVTLLAGIFIVLLLFTVIAMRRQVQASENKVMKLANALSEHGITQPDSNLPTINPPQDRGSSSTFTNAAFTFSYPAQWKTRDDASGVITLVSDPKLFELHQIPATAGYVRVRAVNMSYIDPGDLSKLERVKTILPHAVGTSVKKSPQGYQVIEVTNMSNGRGWQVGIIIAAPGRYVYVESMTPASLSAYQGILSTLKVR